MNKNFIRAIVMTRKNDNREKVSPCNCNSVVLPFYLVLVTQESERFFSNGTTFINNCLSWLDYILPVFSNGINRMIGLSITD